MPRYGTAVPLGSGSYADVYRSFDAQLQRTVALKFLRWNEPEPVERMFREARAQARVDHEGVCKVYDTGWLDGRPFIAMQFIEGDDLLTASRDLPLRRRLRLVIKVARAVQAAHEQGLVHRDLKPDNILVHKSADGSLRPVVLDFGLVYDLAGSTGRMTRDGEPLGTPAFMSPEQAGGQLDEIDVRTDVYGLGATLYTLLTGRPPFEGGGTANLLIQALEADPVRPRSRVPSLPAEVEQIVLKCLDKEKLRRYGSAQELADDLARFLDGEPVRASRSGWWYPLRKRVRKHRRSVAMTSAICGVAVMSLWSVEQQARESSRRAEYEQRFVQISNDLDWGFRAAQMSSTHDITPSRERVHRRIQELEQELGDLDQVGQGPAHYAIGRAYAALHEDQAARRHLEKAWRLGHRSPEVGYFLGLVIGRQYEDALERVRHVHESELRRIYLDDVITRYREPAKGYLEVGREAEAVSVEYVEALIDFYEERYESALEKLADVRLRLPWLYEAGIAEGKVLRRMADERFEESRLEEALGLYRRAEVALRRAMESAASDPRIYPELCRLMSTRIEAELDWSIPPDAATFQDHLKVCDRGLEVDPLSSRAHRASALAYELKARVLVDRSWDPEQAGQALETAEKLAAEAVRLQPYDADGHATLAKVRMTRGRLADVTGDSGDQLSTYLSAGQSLERAIVLTSGPKDPLRIQLATNHQLVAGVQGRLWRPADKSWRQAIELIEDELSQAPRSFTLQCELGNAELGLAYELQRQGRSSTEALDRAQAGFERCLELNEKYHWAYIGLADILSSRGAAECLAGQYHGDWPSRARDLADQVKRLDPGFESGDLRKINYWSTEAHCRLMAGESPSRALRAMTELVDQAQDRGHDVGFWRAYIGTLELRRLLSLGAPVGSRERVALRSVLDRLVGEDPPTDEGVSDEGATISRRLYRIDQLLWMAEAAWELDRSSLATELMDQIDAHLSRLAAPGNLHLVERPQFQAQVSVLKMMRSRHRRGQMFAAELRACERELRRQLGLQPWMAPHVRPWLHRLDRLAQRIG